MRLLCGERYHALKVGMRWTKKVGRERVMRLLTIWRESFEKKHHQRLCALLKLSIEGMR